MELIYNKPMRKFRVVICTDVEGSECEDIVELPDDCSNADIEKETQEAAWNMVEWYYEELKN